MHELDASTSPFQASFANTHTGTTNHTNMADPHRTPFDTILVNTTPDATPPSTLPFPFPNPTRTLSAKREFDLGGPSRLLTSVSPASAGGSVKAVGEGQSKPPPSLKDRRMQGLGGPAVRCFPLVLFCREPGSYELVTELLCFSFLKMNREVREERGSSCWMRMKIRRRKRRRIWIEKASPASRLAGHSAAFQYWPVENKDV